MTNPRRKEWDKKYRETHKEEINARARARSAEAEARRDPEKRKASRKAYYEKTKAYWVEVKRKSRKKVVDWWISASARIEEIVRKDKEKS